MNKIILSLATIFLCAFQAKHAAAQGKTSTAKTVSDTRVAYTNNIKSTAGINTLSATPLSTQVAIPAMPDSFVPGNIATPNIEQATALQIKYALILNDEVEKVLNQNLFALIDEWLGTRYRMGGEGKWGIDCSAFTKMLYATLFGLALPRTAREQYDQTLSVNEWQLREGDLLFFNTRGGVSHVGMYLQNGKFVHAATSSGVTISDLSDAYWSSRYLGGRRIHFSAPVALRP